MIESVKTGDPLPYIEKDIDQELIMRWAKLSGDFNRLHVDPEYASETRFKGTIAHGPMSLAYLNQLMMECFGKNWAVGGRLLDVRFVAPVRPGDRSRIGGTVKEITETEGGQTVECDIFIEKGEAEKVVVGRSIAKLLKKK